MALPKVSLSLAAGFLLAATAPSVVSAQNITIDGRFSAAQPLAGPNYSIGANLGKQVGGNLFHSFGKFGLATGESATFSGPATVNNVVGRVTGGARSDIDGKIQSNIAGANLFLINPSGIVFGPNATVNVSGAFHASTADYIKMSDAAKFQATHPDGSTLSAAPPAAFGFLTASPANISVNGSALGVLPGKTLGLVGGPVSITAASPPSTSGATLSAPAGTIHVASAAGIGEVPADPRNTAALTVSNFGPVDIKGKSKLDVSDPNGLASGGSVFIRSGMLTIDASNINTDNYGSGPGGQLVLRGDNQVTLSNGTILQAVARGGGRGAGVTISSAPEGMISGDASLVQVDSRGTGESGALEVSAGQLTFRNGARFVSLSRGSGNGGPISIVADSVLLDGGTALDTPTGILSTTLGTTAAAGSSGSISIIAGELALHNGAGILAQSSGAGAGGALVVKVYGPLTVDSRAALVTTAFGSGNAGDVSVMAAGPVTVDKAIGPGATLEGIGSLTLGGGNAGNVSVAAGALIINNSDGISSITADKGNAGNVTVTAGTLSIVNGGVIRSSTFGSGNADSVKVDVTGGLTIDGTMTAGSGFTGISAQANKGSTGNAGSVSVTTGTLSIINGGKISSGTFGPGNGGNVSVGAAGSILLDGGVALDQSTGIFSTTSGSGSGGSVNIVAGQLALQNAANVLSQSSGSGSGGRVNVKVNGPLIVDSGASLGTTTTGERVAGDVSVMVDGLVTIDMSVDAPSQILNGIGSLTKGSGDAGNVTVSATGLSIRNFGKILSLTEGAGNAGSVSVTAGTLSIVNGAEISASAVALDDSANTLGDNGSVKVSVAGALTIDGTLTPTSFTGIASQADPTSIGKRIANVTVSAESLDIINSGEISAGTFGPNAGNVSINIAGRLRIDGRTALSCSVCFTTRVTSQADMNSTGDAGAITIGAGTLTILANGAIGSVTIGSGNGGNISLRVADTLVIDGTGASSFTGITASAQRGSTGRAGDLTIDAGGAITLSGGALVGSAAFDRGDGGRVQVGAQGPLTLRDSGTKISARAVPESSGNAGSVTVSAPQISITKGAEISSTTDGTGAGGSVTVTTPGALVLDGAGIAGTWIAASATGAQSGAGGAVTVMADTLTVKGGAQIASTTAGRGIGGTVQVRAQGPLTLSDAGTGIVANSTAGGDAGSVMVNAPQIAITGGAQIASTTEGTGAGGAVNVTTTGSLMLDGAGVANTRIAASADGLQSGAGGPVKVTANTLTVKGGAQIASTTAGAGKGGDVAVIVEFDIMLPDAGTQITARSSGGGDAGSITVRAARLLMNDGAEISTEAQTSTANGGNIRLKVEDLVYLTSSKITTSVKGQTGSGGDITIDPQLVVLNHHSNIIAKAVEGHGGNIKIIAGALIQSADSSIDASSEKGISGTVVITGPRVDVNGALVVLSSELRGHAAVLREACAAYGDRPVSSLVEAGRGGLPQDPETTLPALYIADRDLSPNPAAGGKTEAESAPLQTTVRLTMHCG